MCDLRKESPLGKNRDRFIRFMRLKAKEVYFADVSGLPLIRTRQRSLESSTDVHAINYAVNLLIRAG